MVDLLPCPFCGGEGQLLPKIGGELIASEDQVVCSEGCESFTVEEWNCRQPSKELLAAKKVIKGMTNLKEVDLSELETYLSDEHIDKIRDLLKRYEAAKECAAVLDHAIEIGYWSEGGSTANWAKDALKNYKLVTGEE